MDRCTGHRDITDILLKTVFIQSINQRQDSTFKELNHNPFCGLQMLWIPTNIILTLSQTNPGFYVSGKSLLKTLWEKEKLLVTSNFSFSHSVFYPFGKLSSIFINFKIVVCKVLQFERV